MLELAEDEVKNFFKVWASVLVSLSYCYAISKLIPQGYTRLLAFLPIISLFFTLPLKLTSFHLGGMSAFIIAWLANFKLLLFAFGKGPLCSNPSISFPHFLALSCLPIKLQDDPPLKYSTKSENNTNPLQKSHIKSCPSTEKKQKSVWNYIIKGALVALIVKIVFDYSDFIHPNILWLIFSVLIYFNLELNLAVLAASAKLFAGFELEPQFHEPLLSTSLQDFWGKRWNLMVTRILRPTVFLPTRDLATRVVGRTWAPLPAVMSSFLVSALMHELIFYYLGREHPTFEVTWFFLLHGFCLCIEIVVKKIVGGKWRIPPWISGPMTVLFVLGTGFWLFLPPLMKAGLDTRPFQEYEAVAKFARRLKAWLTFKQNT